MKIPKKLIISETLEYSDGDLSLSHLDDIGKCHIMTSAYGEVTSVSLNKTQVKRVINWLHKWTKFKESTLMSQKENE